MRKRVGSDVNTDHCKAWGLLGDKTRRTVSKMGSKGNDNEERKQTLALCPIILSIFETIAGFFFFGVGHFLKVRK